MTADACMCVCCVCVCVLCVCYTHTGLVEELVDCSGGDDISLDSGTQRKIEGLMRVLGKHKASRTLVFCNKIEACRSVENALRRKYDPSEAQVGHMCVCACVRVRLLCARLYGARVLMGQYSWVRSRPC